MKMMKRVVFAVVTIMMLGELELTTASGQTNPTVYLEAKDEFANYFSAGVIRKNVPVTLTADLQHAGYVARFTRATNEGSKTLGVLSALMTGVYMKGSYERVSMTLLERKTGDVIYSHACLKGGGHIQSVAECLAYHLKAAFANGKIKMKPFTGSELEAAWDSEAATESVRKTGDALPARKN
jgi:hypothetical protein